MDALFKALADPARRTLMDALRQRDGQTLSDLEALLEMSRFGVMKHLKVLEDAHLVTTKKVGRFKYHYLNALPLQEAIDRWIDPFLKPQAQALGALKAALETPKMTKPDFVMSTYIRCTQDALWEALTDPVQMARWHFLSNKIDLKGDTLHYYHPDGTPMLSCRTLSTEPKNVIEATFEPHWEGGGKPSRTVMRITPEAGHCRLTVEHYSLTFPVVPGEGVADGWERWASGLKTFIETGEPQRFNETGVLA